MAMMTTGTESNGATGALERGVAVIRRQVRTLPAAPGVYRMQAADGEVLYVGKARDLKRRVASYANLSRHPARLLRLVAEIAAIEVVTTHTEVEALLLESNLIKRHGPRFNVLLRDDKSFPYILLTTDSEWCRLTKYRGARDRPGDYFGPFASAGAVNRTLAALERAFLLRSCSDGVFRSRSRPCLLHQIKRCSAPCVGRVSRADYDALVAQARRFLSGRSQEVQRDLARRMQEASDRLDFENAAIYRDRIRALAQIQARQDINVAGLEDADVIAAHQAGGQTCVQVFFFRGGRNYGNRAYFPRHDRAAEAAEVLAAFLGQFYDNKPPPPLVLVSHRPAEQALIAEALSVRAGRRVRVTAPQRGPKRKLVAHAAANAEAALGRRLAESASQRRLLEGVAEAFDLEAPPRRVEVFDNSHIQGTNAVGAMIVAGPDGFVKSAYRKFNIRGATAGGAPGEATPGDDYAMMREVLGRRFARALKEDGERTGDQWPDLVVIDGGKGQLGAAAAALEDLGIDDVPIVAIAKGPERDAGRERFYLLGRSAPVVLHPRDPVLYFLQRLRDEAHRFAIGAHRTRRAKDIHRSPLDAVPGVGARRKRALLHHFGSARNVARAGLADLEAVDGISKTVAKRIYDHFHADR